MSAETPSSFGALTLLARALCEDARIGLVASTRGWAWDPARRTILVDCNDLERSGLHVAAGVIAHEVGHARVSRMTLAGGADLPAPLAHLLLNALAIWMFGSEVEERLGTPRFAVFCAVCGVGAAASVVAVELLLGRESLVLGSSGVVFGILMAYGMLFAERVIPAFRPPAQRVAAAE